MKCFSNFFLFLFFSEEKEKKRKGDKEDSFNMTALLCFLKNTF